MLTLQGSVVEAGGLFFVVQGVEVAASCRSLGNDAIHKTDRVISYKHTNA
jgi:hypothetical protein